MSYSPSGGAVSKQLPFGMSNLPLDAKLMYDDQVNFTKRAFISTAEILTYFPAGSPFRNGNFEILLNTGGTLSNGVITGGIESIWWFSRGNLIQKYYTTLQVDNLISGITPVTPSLQQVTAVGRTSSNAIQFTGINNLNPAIDSLAIFGGVGETGLINIIGGQGTGALGFKPSEARFVFQTSPAPGDTTVFLLRTEDESTAGANINRRISFEAAVNGTEGVTLDQLNNAIPDLSGYEVLANKSTSTTLGTSNTLYPTQGAVKSYIDTGLALKANIAGQVFTGNISATNLSGTNTGDQNLAPYELLSNKVGNLTSPNANTYINTLGLSNLLSTKVNTSTAITGGYGVTIGGDLSSAVSVTLNTSVVDNRYLRKDIADNNGAFKLTTGSFETGGATINDDLLLPSLGTGTSDDILVIDGTGLVQKKTLIIAGDFGIANAAGTNQFDVSLGTDLRFEGANDTTVTFDPTTKKVTISSVPGSGGGGAVVSWNTRTGAVIPLSGDYNTSQVTELTNLYFTNARVLTAPLTGFSVSNVAITATDTVIQAFNKAQGQINNLVPITRTITVAGTSGRIVIGGGDTQDLSVNRAWTIDLVTTGTAGTYKSVTTDAYGRIISGTNPTTLSAFGITDAYTKTESDAKYYLQTNPAGYITSSDLTPYELKSNFEKIPFTAATGTINIDFTINSRQSKFPNPDIRAYNVSGSIEDKIIGFNEQITRSGANISTVELNYISGDGYILLTNN